MLQPISIRYAFRPRRRSLACAEVADLFGLSDEQPPYVVAENLELDVRPGDVVLFTGPSGSGKSSLLRAVSEQLGAMDIHSPDLPAVPLVDALGGPVPRRLDLLAACGLSEARLMLRTPAELSDGQRYRFRLAYTIQDVVACGSRRNRFLMADEFAAMLDRTLAKVLAFNVRKMAWRSGVGVLAATTHEDLVEDLNPDMWVQCRGDGEVGAVRRDPKDGRPVSRAVCGSRKAPAATGRISLGGITADTDSVSSAGSCCCGTATTRSASACSWRRRRVSNSGRGFSD